MNSSLVKGAVGGEFIEAERRADSLGRAFTTAEMIAYEKDAMRAGQNQHAAVTSFATRREIAKAHGHLTEQQRQAVKQVLSSHDQVTALEGVAGAGKTTALAAIRQAAEREGYRVEGLAPTSRAAHKLAEAGIESSTLQRHLIRTSQDAEIRKHFYILDESSLASTKQMNQFLRGLNANDRVLLVGDTRQHQAVEAGKPHQQLQDPGIQITRLDEIIRQKDPALKEVVEKLSRGRTREAIERLDSGRAVAFNIGDSPHLDYGYAVTSHSSQGQTADRVLVHVDTEQEEKLVNQRLAYVAVSRGRYDAQIYTNDQSQLAEGLSRSASHRSALELNLESASGYGNERSSRPSHTHSEGHGISR